MVQYRIFMCGSMDNTSAKVSMSQIPFTKDQGGEEHLLCVGHLLITSTSLARGWQGRSYTLAYPCILDTKGADSPLLLLCEGAQCLDVAQVTVTEHRHCRV